MTVVGLDCGRGNVTACAISAPISNLKEFARSYKPIVLKSNRADLEALLELGDFFVIEPTGSDHRIFANWLEKRGKRVLYCQGGRIRSHALSRGLTNKKDREDAAAIADFSWRALNDPADYPNAFLNLKAGERIRDARNNLKSINRARSPIVNQLWAKLAIDLPELLHSDSGTKRRFSQREWLEPHPPKLLRWLAGEIEYVRMDALLGENVGSGITPLIRSLASSLCLLERQEYAIECELEELLNEIEPFYHAAFDKWALSRRLRADILSSCYPFEKFLGEDGRPIHEWVPAVSENAKHDRTFRDRSLKRFMLQVGFGRVIAESGKSKGNWVMGGSKATRVAIYLQMGIWQMHVEGLSKPRRRKKTETDQEYKQRLKANWQPFKDWLEEITAQYYLPKVPAWDNPQIVAAAAERNHCPPAVASLQIYKVLSPTCQNIGNEQRLCKLASKVCRELYRELLRQYLAAKG
jgi:hypothetical protein